MDACDRVADGPPEVLVALFNAVLMPIAACTFCMETVVVDDVVVVIEMEADDGRTLWSSNRAEWGVVLVGSWEMECDLWLQGRGKREGGREGGGKGGREGGRREGGGREGGGKREGEGRGREGGRREEGGGKGGREGGREEGGRREEGRELRREKGKGRGRKEGEYIVGGKGKDKREEQTMNLVHTEIHVHLYIQSSTCTCGYVRRRLSEVHVGGQTWVGLTQYCGRGL